MTAARLTETPAADESSDLSCPRCRADVGTTWEPYTFPYGVDEDATELTAVVPVRRCTVCGFEFLDCEAEKIELEAVCQHLRIVSPAGIRRIREQYGMTRSEFASVTGLGMASLTRWENGSMNQSRAYDRYMRLLEHPHVMRLLQKIVQPSNDLSGAANTGRGACRVLDMTEELGRRQRDFNLRRHAA